MTHWTETLNRKQAYAARTALEVELSIASHVQARRSEIDGLATVEVFVGRRCHTVTLGPNGGVKRREVSIVA